MEPPISEQQSPVNEREGEPRQCGLLWGSVVTHGRARDVMMVAQHYLFLSEGVCFFCIMRVV